MSESTDLEPIGDRELHVCKGWLRPSNEEWYIPVFVQAYRSEDQEFAKVAPAVGLMAEQARYLAYHFSLHNKWRREDCFLIDRKALELLAYRAQGITPAYYYHWPGQSGPVFDPKKKLHVNSDDVKTEIPEDAFDFLEFVHRRRHIDLNVLRLAWLACAREAATWLRKKPINLGFAKLYAVPYRINWKEILLAWFPNAYWWLKVHKAGEAEVKNSELYSKFAAMELMAIHGRTNYHYWTLEIVPTEAFEEEVAEMEMAKLAGGGTAYVHAYEKTVADLSPWILEIFTSYLEKAARSFPKLVAGIHPGSQRLVPYRGPKKLLPKVPQSIPCRIVVNAGPQKLSDGDPALLVRPQANGLSPVSAALPANDAVRESDGATELVQSADKEDRTTRLPLCDEFKSTPAWKPVFSGKEHEREAGLDTGTD